MRLNNLALIILLTTFSPIQTDAKTWTIEERQQKLMQEINAGQKSGELTIKEAHCLRKKEANIARKKTKMKAKNLGHLSNNDINDIEKDLNQVSLDLNKYRLEKRITKDR